ncbi:MAG: RND transporter, partial [Planctomycetota bacterium]
MSRIFDRTFGATVDHRPLTLLLILAVTGLAVLGYVAPHRLTGLFTQEPAESDSQDSTAGNAVQPTPDVDPVSLSDSDVVLVVDSDDFFTPQGASALRAIVESLEELDYVESILWMDEVPVLNIFGLQQPLLPRATASARQFEESREKALSHPLVHGQLLSTDGRTLLLLIKINWLFVESDEDCTTRLREVAEQAAAAYPETEFSFLTTGRVPIYLTFMQAHSENLWKYQMIGYGMVGLMAVILFRGIR